MSLLKKLAFATAAATLIVGMAASGAMADNMKIALVVKNLGNGFFDAANKGAQEAAKELGGVDIIYTGPTQATPEGQIDIINQLVSQKVNAIAISANDADALVPALQAAMKAGVTVISFDSGVSKDGRQMNLSPRRPSSSATRICRWPPTCSTARRATSPSCRRPRPRPTRMPGSM